MHAVSGTSSCQLQFWQQGPTGDRCSLLLSIVLCCLKQPAAHLHRCMKASICANTALLSIFQGLPPPLATALAVRWYACFQLAPASRL